MSVDPVVCQPGRDVLPPAGRAGCVSFLDDAPDADAAPLSVRPLAAVTPHDLEQHYDDLADTLGDTVFEMDLQGRVTWVNRSAFKRWGYTEEEFRHGLSAFELLAPEDRERARENVRRVFEGERSHSEYAALRKDGTRFWIQVTSGRVMRDGRLLGLRGIAVDVTARKLAEDALRESERRFRNLYNNTPVMMHSIDRDGRLVSVSDYWLKALGYTRDEVIGRRSTDFLTEASRRYALEQVLPEFMRTGVCSNVEYQFVTKDGQVLDTLLSATAERDETGAVKRSLAVVLDVTDRRRAEQAIRHSEQKYRSLFENAVFGIYRTTLDGRFLEANPAMAAMLGYTSPSELVGRDIADCYEDPAERARLVEQYACAAKVEGIEVAWKRADGSRLVVRLTGRPVHDANGHVEGFEMIAEDVTERRQLEQQLQQAQKMEAIGRLAGGIAHDFSNLLTAIGGHSDLLLDQLAPDDPRRDEVVEIRQAVDRASSLTRQLLVFSRKQILNPTPVNLNGILEGLVPLLQRLLGEDVQLVTIPAPGLGLILADPIQAEQVIMSLAVNARDAMPRGGRLSIETRNVALGASHEPGGQRVLSVPHVMLAVTDTGCGMDDEVRSHLFEPFFTTKDPSKGTGLGLATVYAIVQQSGGHIHVESEPHQGTTFEIYFPRLDASDTAARPVRTGAARSGSETILLAEDEDAVRSVMRTALTRQGYRVLEARTGDEALAVAAACPDRIHLLLTDVVMPGMGGRELARRLTMQVPFLRVVYTSGHTDDVVVRTRSLEPGAVFLPKPFTPARLATVVRETLDAAMAP